MCVFIILSDGQESEWKYMVVTKVSKLLMYCILKGRRGWGFLPDSLHPLTCHLKDGDLQLWQQSEERCNVCVGACQRLVHPVSLWPGCQSCFHLSVCKQFCDSALTVCVRLLLWQPPPHSLTHSQTWTDTLSCRHIIHFWWLCFERLFKTGCFFLSHSELLVFSLHWTQEKNIFTW